MEYTIQKLAHLAGISTRTLRYYDQIGLLSPARTNEAGYRIYGTKEVDVLQQILFYKEMGLELTQIKEAIQDAEFDSLAAFRSHLEKLIEKRRQIDLLIENVKKTIEKEEGKNKMSDQEKFEGFKKELVEKNEREYGKEVREKYGDEVVDQSNAKMMGLTEEQYTHMQELGEKINLLLEEAVKNHEYVEDEIGEQVALLHKEWLSYTWPTYSTQAHRGLVQMYVLDERFKAYYDKNVEGCAEFLKQAVEYHMV